MVDDITTLPSMFALIYANNMLRTKCSGTQKNILVSLRFFYVYYYKKYKRTFDYDFYLLKYNISTFIHDFDGFFDYMLGEQHLNDKEDIIPIGYLHKTITKRNKVTYGGHIRHIGGFFRYLNYRYISLKYQDMSLTEAHKISTENRRCLDEKLKCFNRLEVSNSQPASRYKSITEQQTVELNNMIIPSTPAFTDVETGEHFEKVINPQNPFKEGFLQYRNYLMHRLMYTYGLRVGEVLLVSLDSVGETLPDACGNTKFILTVHNLPDDFVDPRKRPPSIKTQNSYRRIELTDDDFILFAIYMERYRAPLFEDKGIDDHGTMFINSRGDLLPLSYDGIRSIYRDKIDPAFIALHPYYRMENKKKIDYMVTLNPHVGRHTWAYITLKFIYNDLLIESLTVARDYGIRARINGEMDAAVEELRTLGGWSFNSKMPLMYAKRFVEMISNESNIKRTKRGDWQTAIPVRGALQYKAESTYNPSEENCYDEDIPFGDLFN
ncbi:site-specific integrase [Vibrio splendidus]|nr:site-specific integrase [Vibrio splendidus]